MKFEQLEHAKSRAMPPCVPTWSMCQRGLRANVLACQRGLRTKVAKACQLLIFTFQRVIRLAIFFFILACQRANKGAKFFKHFCYQVLRKISILYYYIKNSTFYLISVIHIICKCIVNKNCIIIFISMLHVILKKSVWNFSFFLFCSLVIN